MAGERVTTARLVRESIAEQVYAIIKEEILCARRKPGEQINPREVATKLGLSVMPIRDALKQLVDEGLVVRKPRVGFFVRSLSSQEVQEIMEVRKLYELYCLEEYFDKIDREKLLACLKHCRKRNTLAEGEEFERLDDNIHSLIVQASGNVFLIGSYNNIKDLIVLIRHLIRGQTHKANEEHIALLEAILEGDKARAKAILKDHIDRVARSVCS
jgi:DNA-binding GntR family transcriptional regulator